MSKKMQTLLPLLIAGLLFGETTIQRGQFWGRLTFAPKLERGLGLFLSAGMRDNYSIKKEVDAIEKPATEQHYWLKELMIGPSYSTKLSSKVTLNGQVLYRPQLWYPGESSNYLRHTIMYNSNLFQRLGKIKLHYRLSLWHQFAATQSGTTPKEFDNELYIRIMAGPVFPLGKRVTLFTKVEPFLKVTASESDVDGTEFFNKLVLWNGFSYKMTKELSLSAQYVQMTTFPHNTLTVRDHYLYLHLIFQPTFHSTKK